MLTDGTFSTFCSSCSLHTNLATTLVLGTPMTEGIHPLLIPVVARIQVVTAPTTVSSMVLASVPALVPQV